MVFRRLPSGLWIVLGVALALRLGWGLTRSSTDAAINALPDQREYLSIAQNILGGRGAEFFDRRFEQTVYAYRMPGYSWFVAVCGCDPRVVRVVQALLDTSTVLAVFLLAGRTKSPSSQPSPAVPGEGAEAARASSSQVGINPSCDASPASSAPALLAAAIVAINPFLIYFSGLLLSETLFTAMLVWGMVLLLSPTSRTIDWLSGIILLALSIYVRPSALLLPVILGFASVPAATARLNRAALAGVVILAALAPWGWRNAHQSVVGRWIWTTTNGGVTAYDGWNPTADGGSNQAFLRDMPELRDMGEIQRSDYLAGRARDFVMAHRLRAVQLGLHKLVRLWSPMPLSEQYSSLAYRAGGLLYCVPFDLLVLAGLIRGKLSPAAKVFLLLPAIYLTVVHMASVGSLRYLLPAIPPMAVVAGSFLPRPRPGRVG
jgi:hypothetical protein